MRTIVELMSRIPVVWRIVLVSWGSGWLVTTSLPFEQSGTRMLLGTVAYLLIYCLLYLHERRSASEKLSETL